MFTMLWKAEIQKADTGSENTNEVQMQHVDDEAAMNGGNGNVRSKVCDVIERILKVVVDSKAQANAVGSHHNSAHSSSTYNIF